MRSLYLHIPRTEFSPTTSVIEVLYFSSSWLHLSGLGTCLGEAPLPELSRTENRGRYLFVYEARTKNLGTTKKNCIIPNSCSSPVVPKWAFERRETELSRAEVAAAQSLSQCLSSSQRWQVHGLSVPGSWVPHCPVAGDWNREGTKPDVGKQDKRKGGCVWQCFWMPSMSKLFSVMILSLARSRSCPGVWPSTAPLEPCSSEQV